MEMNRIQMGSVDAHPKTSEGHSNFIYEKLWLNNPSFWLWRADRKLYQLDRRIMVTHVLLDLKTKQDDVGMNSTLY